MAENHAKIRPFLRFPKKPVVCGFIFSEIALPRFLGKKNRDFGCFCENSRFLAFAYTYIFPGFLGETPIRPPRNRAQFGLNYPKRVKRPKNSLCVHLFFCDLLDLGLKSLSQATIERERCILYLNSREIRSDISEKRYFQQKIDVRKGQKSTFSPNRLFWPPK